MRGDSDPATNPEMNRHAASAPDVLCPEWQPLLMLSAAGGELDDGEQDRLSAHLAQCPACSQSLEREREFLALLSENRAEPDATLLASCRASLTDALDRQEEGGWLRRAFQILLPADWPAPRPAWSAAVLLLIGFSVGVLGPRLLRRPADLKTSDNSVPAISATNDSDSAQGTSADSSDANPFANLSPSPLDLRTADVAGIDVLPSEGDDDSPRVELELRSQQPVTLSGTVNNDDVKDVLLGVLRNGERFCPDVRLDAVDLLRPRNNDPDVRAALCHTVRNDRNAAVRLKALEALDGAGPQDIVQQTLLDALVDDDNPGVRVEAINELRDLAAKGRVSSDDGHMMSVLRERMQKDPNTYIRLQSAQVIRELGPREKF
jgi:HEAT repeats/Putative zinc-finger